MVYVDGCCVAKEYKTLHVSTSHAEHIGPPAGRWVKHFWAFTSTYWNICKLVCLKLDPKCWWLWEHVCATAEGYYAKHTQVLSVSCWVQPTPTVIINWANQPPPNTIISNLRRRHQTQSKHWENTQIRKYSSYNKKLCINIVRYPLEVLTFFWGGGGGFRFVQKKNALRNSELVIIIDGIYDNNIVTNLCHKVMKVKWWRSIHWQLHLMPIDKTRLPPDILTVSCLGQCAKNKLVQKCNSWG